MVKGIPGSYFSCHLPFSCLLLEQSPCLAPRVWLILILMLSARLPVFHSEYNDHTNSLSLVYVGMK